jgi:hypothetical protein
VTKEGGFSLIYSLTSVLSTASLQFADLFWFLLHIPRRFSFGSSHIFFKSPRAPAVLVLAASPPYSPPSLSSFLHFYFMLSQVVFTFPSSYFSHLRKILFFHPVISIFVSSSPHKVRSYSNAFTWERGAGLFPSILRPS